MRINRSFARMRPLLLMALVLTFVLAAQVAPTYAATITVDTTADDFTVNGNCTLREAVEAANTNAVVDTCASGAAGADDIIFSVGGTITLVQALGQLSVLDTPLSIIGPITIDGGRTGAGGSGSRVFLVGNPLINDTLPRSLSLSGVVVRNGRPNISVAASSNSGGAVNSSGGCVYVRPNSTFSISASTITGCRAPNGAGIFADEDTTVNVNNSSLISLNIASTNGGGINITTGFVTVDTESCIQSNSAGSVGGGIYAGDTVFITMGGGSASNRGFLIANSAGGGGGGIYIDVNSTFVGNHARMFSNTSFGPGSAWFSQGGSSSSNGADVGRSCVNCCIVNNSFIAGNTNYAVYQEVGGLIANFQNNWWGNNWGPRIFDLDPTQADTTIGSSVSNGDGISGDGALAVNVGLTDDGSWNNPRPTGAWLTALQASPAPAVPETRPSDCQNDICTAASSVATTRSCTVIKLT